LQAVTKRELTKVVAEKAACNKLVTGKVVDVLFNHMREVLIDGNRIEIGGFGVFSTKNTRPKPAARNPRTGETVYVPARRKTQFKSGKNLKDALRQPKEITDGQPKKNLKNRP